MTLAPIAVFAFNRLPQLKNTVSSLLANSEAKDSDLFVFVDGPRQNKDGEKLKVEQVQEYVKTITGFKSLTYSFSEQNKGLGTSVISGVTKVLDEYDRVIVVEDDLYVSKSFLRFMNQMLYIYNDDSRIMQVSGFGCKLSKIYDYKWDAYMNERAHSWTWGTWVDRWKTVDWEVKDFNEINSSFIKQLSFNKRGSDLFKMLKGYMTGQNHSWYIRFNYSMFKQGRYSIMPIKSLVLNEGFGSDATNCNNYNRYEVDFEEEHRGDFIMPEYLEPHEGIIRNSVRYWSFLYRLYGKIMTFFSK